MSSLVVVDDTRHWPAAFEGVSVVTAWDYLTSTKYHKPKGQRVYNLCHSYRYQSSGYYVSLLAAARGQRPLPDVTTIQDLRWRSVVRDMTYELDELIQKSLQPLSGNEFVLSIYFGRNLAERYRRLAIAIFNLLPAPLLRASFHCRSGKWQLTGVSPIPLDDVPEGHRSFLLETVATYFKRPLRPPRRQEEPAYDLAILVNPEEKFPPSNASALRKFGKAAEENGFDVQFITKNDFGRISEFDALFIRETTQVNHYTYRLARRAAVEGLVVIDDPQSIIRCANKVYLAERLRSFGLPAPETRLLHRDNALKAAESVGFPCILKPPDESFSRGMVKVDHREDLESAVNTLLEKSDLIVAQAFLPTDFDWRVGVLDGEAIYVCRYYMVKHHWQIYRTDTKGHVSAGNADTLSVEDAPPEVVALGVAAANTIGDGLYGVDIKEHSGRLYVVEINDNPSIDAGCEDKVLGPKLYGRIMKSLFSRVQKSKERSSGR
jgi:glutathione synthase/RimK-type ligase-like ATP-grasp enzyme